MKVVLDVNHMMFGKVLTLVKVKRLSVLHKKQVIFHKDVLEAEQLMMMVHEKGKASIGAYPYDIAVSKVQTATGRAKEEGFPFRMTIEEA